MAKYALLISITSSDTGAHLSGLINQIDGKLMGADIDEGGVYNRHNWGVGGTPVKSQRPNNPAVLDDVEAAIFIGFNSDVGQGVLSRLNSLQQRAALCRQFGPFDPPMTRQQIADRLTEEAGMDSATHVLHLEPGPAGNPASDFAAPTANGLKDMFVPIAAALEAVAARKKK